jgi:hypothetical protein
MKKTNSVNAKIVKPKVSRPGVHSKTKSSNHKGSKNYLKKYRGQG